MKSVPLGIEEIDTSDDLVAEAEVHCDDRDPWLHVDVDRPGPHLKVRDEPVAGVVVDMTKLAHRIHASVVAIAPVHAAVTAARSPNASVVVVYEVRCTVARVRLSHLPDLPVEMFCL